MKNITETDDSVEIGNSSKYGSFGGERGFPRKCVCGSDLAVYTSQSKLNPGRPYFRCARNREDIHLFKWVEDGMYEEVKDLLIKFQRRESEIDNGMIEVNELKIEVHNLKEEAFECKTELHQSKMKILVLFVCLCVLVFVIIYLMLASQGTNLLFDN